MKFRITLVTLALALCLTGCGPSSDVLSSPNLSVKAPPALAGAAKASSDFVPIQPVQTSDLARASLLITTNVHRFNLPDSFRQRLEDRAFLDLYEVCAYGLGEPPAPAPRKLVPIPTSSPRFIRLLHSQTPAAVLSHRNALHDKMVPLRGYRAPILDQATNNWPALPDLTHPSPALQEAAAILELDLARVGLLPVLARMVEALGVSSARENPDHALTQFRSAGFPVDLLAFFHPPSMESATPRDILAWTAGKLAAGQPLVSVERELQAVPFRFQPSLRGFEPVLESKAQDIGTVRMQLGGGYRNGVVPGGSIDMIAHLVADLPNANFILSVPAEFMSNLRNLAANYWPLHRPGQITLLSEPITMSAWAQDNGKAGLYRPGGSEPIQLATLVPRYACQGEGESGLMPGDTFLADGLPAAGQVVAQSPLLFQGGNLMPVEDPKTGQRLLLLGEAEVYRNVALGLSRDQTLEALRAEFGADRCVVLPVVSFHIDFDVSLREHNGRMVAFVNDPMAAARLILERGLETLADHQAIAGAEAQQLRSQLADGNLASAHAGLSRALGRLLDANERFPTEVVSWFAQSPQGNPSVNFRYFLLALDLVAGNIYASNEARTDPDRKAYWAALRRLETAARDQVRLFQSLGWTVVAVPSMPDVASGINYLNGLHESTRYLMPAHGGFYRSVDEAAAQAFSQALDSKVQIVPVDTLECQEQHGALHCAASVFPKIPATHNAQGEPGP